MQKIKAGRGSGVCGGEQVPSEVRDDLTAKVVFLERPVGEKGGSREAMESYVRDVRQAEKPARAKGGQQEGQQNELLQKQRGVSKDKH